MTTTSPLLPRAGSTPGAGRSDVPEFEPHGTSRELVVLMHAYSIGRSSLRYVRDVVAAQMPNADILAPDLSAGVFSTIEPNAIARRVVDLIDDRWERRQVTSDGHVWPRDTLPYEKIIFVGHSLGALIARKAYVFACGDTGAVPLEPPYAGTPYRRWAKNVERLVLLAAMNRGWAISHHLAPLRALGWWIGVGLGNVAMMFGKQFLIQTIRRGAPFLTQLRLQWLAMRRQSVARGVGGALTIQLLGTVDDMVAPGDNIDLVTGSDFVYIDVPNSGHSNVRVMDDSDAGKRRRAVFVTALTDAPETLRKRPALIEDRPPPDVNYDVTDVVFIVHGIRDLGFWTQRIARAVAAEAEALNAGPGTTQKCVVRTETASYGYFTMLPFIFPWTRRSKVQWLMDRYVDNTAMWPNARFSFVGHSNGTYLLARALKEYSTAKFKHVVFAGSVVNNDYEWDSLLQNGRVEKVLNYVATGDWVVAFFPKGFGMLGARDLGSAGHDGFRINQLTTTDTGAHPGFHEVKWVQGGHGAAIDERNWESIAKFIVRGTVHTPPEITRDRRNPLVAIGGHIPPIVWLLLIGAAVAVGRVLVDGLHGQPQWMVTTVLITYLFLLWRVVTRV